MGTFSSKLFSDTINNVLSKATGKKGVITIYSSELYD